jgi:energy-coupling factor transporter ATP-binding protein EcfA2
VVLEPDITVLVGRNDTGKSSLVNALWVYGQVAADGFRALMRDRGPVGADAPTFRTQWRDDRTGELYDHIISPTRGRLRESLAGPFGECTWDPRDRVLRWGRKRYEADGIPRLASLGSVAPSEWRSETDVPDELSECLGLARGFSTPVPYLFEPSMLAHRTTKDFVTTDRNGLGWANLLQEVLNRRDRSMERLEAGLKSLFPFFRSVALVEEQLFRYTRVVGADARFRGELLRPGPRPKDDDPQLERALRFQVETRGSGARRPVRKWVSAESMSSGLLLAAAYLTAAYAAPEGSLVVLEEPENGLNRILVRNMMERFLEVVQQRKQQLIMTTHNEFWLDYVGPDRIRVVTRDESGSHVWAASDNMRKLQEEGFALSEVMAVGGPEQLIEERRCRP